LQLLILLNRFPCCCGWLLRFWNITNWCEKNIKIRIANSVNLRVSRLSLFRQVACYSTLILLLRTSLEKLTKWIITLSIWIIIITNRCIRWLRCLEHLKWISNSISWMSWWRRSSSPKVTWSCCSSSNSISCTWCTWYGDIPNIIIFECLRLCSGIKETSISTNLSMLKKIKILFFSQLA